MVTIVKLGSLTKRARLSNPSSGSINPWTFRAQEVARTCSSIAPIANGRNCSSMKVRISRMFKIKSALMFQETRTKKREMLSPGSATMVLTRNGGFPILSKKKRKQDLTATGASSSTSHSGLSQDYQARELLKQSGQTILS